MDQLNYLMRLLTRLDSLTGVEREQRRRGLDWPKDGAETMVGMERLENVALLALEVIQNRIPGDFMECGIWRGGVGILMAKIIELHHQARRVFLADSFDGCPVPTWPEDSGDPHSTFEFLKVTPAEVTANLERYGVHSGVELLPGWFKDTLPGPVRQLALLRVDGDMYESTTQCLDALYDLVSPGGYVILDDYQNIPNCRRAIDDFRARRGITAPIQTVDWCAVYWKVETEAKRRAA